LRLYGTDSRAVTERGSDSLVLGGSVLTGEVDWAVQEEGAARLEDWLYRRARAALYEPAERGALIRPGAERMASLLNWTPARTEEEVARVQALLESELNFARPVV
jgi:glycerol-3-phosphate dehydrogenase